MKITIVTLLLVLSVSLLAEPPERININYKYHCEQMLVIKQCSTFEEVADYLEEYGYPDVQVQEIWEIYQKQYMDKLTLMERGSNGNNK